MTILLTAWAIIGLAHWVDWMVSYSDGRLLLLDIVVGLPVFVILGPLTTIRKLLN